MKKKITFYTIIGGHLLEVYEITLYGWCITLFAQLYFTTDNLSTSTIASFGTYAAGFFMRPVGGIVFGHIGDRIGRKYALLASILLMSISTLAIGILPTYHQIGLCAPITLIIFRLLQGLSVGGEYSGSLIFLTEHLQMKRNNFIASILVSVGFLGALLATILSALFTSKLMPAWAWRIPFILGGVLGFCGYLLR